ncbi:MAG TPA: MarC family protein [Acidiphilium sp.]|nr:MAG: antibiotic resistance protein MarC [Acidiphilium sp. 21-60-14]OYV89426.1 MAG: antibiotic resistance protein MarC [Acidiphilium sp. 37-60-79]OZB37958.1 MAG: antibiotic resistance protein MarC [Acidiphilium sp. 34-60-192]HQT89394.1 MarC family protein [Acidiphilium sp.]
MNIAFAATFLGALFAIMNPFINLPFFLAMTADNTVAEQRKIALQVVTYTAVMCVVISLAGNVILGFFGISVSAFRVAGGLVLLGIAFSMLNGHQITAHERGDHEKKSDPGPDNEDDNIAFYPMTFPLIVGPGTIATLIIYMAQARSVGDYAAFALIVAVLIVALFVALYFAAAIGKLLSARMRVIMTRLMGMILAAIAVGMVVNGLKILLPGLA